MITAIIVLMQFMISAKAGLVNYIEGRTNVHVHQQVPAGTPIETSQRSHAEILLNPGSFLRLDENTTVVLDSVELANIEVRVVTGTALIETAQVDKQAPIRVTSGNLKTTIVSSGVYRFSGDTASVIDGKLRTTDGSITARKGQEITAIAEGQYEKGPLILIAGSTELDQWSQQRSADLARANALAANQASRGYLYSNNGWIYSPFLAGFTFIPLRSYRSYWGYSFAPVAVFTQHVPPATVPAGTVSTAAAPKPSPRPITGSSSGRPSAMALAGGSHSSGGHGGGGHSGGSHSGGGHGGGHR
jgi:hypothetical protein